MDTLPTGRLRFFGVSPKKTWKDWAPRNILNLSFRVLNTGAAPIQLKELALRQYKPGVLAGRFWILSELEADGRRLDLKSAPLIFAGSESRHLNCEFYTIDETPLGNIGIDYVHLVALEKTRVRERESSVLLIQVDAGRHIEIAFPDSAEYINWLQQKWLREEREKN